jgi:hypothetical protein
MVFDTDVLIWFLQGNREAARLIGSQSDRAMSVVCAI